METGQIDSGDAGQSSLSAHSESSKTSKTDSNVSKQSGGQGTVALEDKGLTPVDMECHIQGERITKSLDKLVYQTKVALSIPYLMKDPALPRILSEQNFADICCIYEQYEKPLYSASFLNMAAVEDMKAGDISLRHRVNPELCFMIYTLCGYRQLKPRVEIIIHGMKNKYANGMAPPAFLYLLQLEQFRKLMVVRMTNTAAEELAIKLHTKRLEESNNNQLAKIAIYTKCLKEENEKFERDILERNEIIEQLKQEIQFSIHKDSIRRKKNILDSERQMVLATRRHGIKYQMLSEEATEIHDHYETSLRNNMAIEKSLRHRRIKVETQLQSWLQKYDIEMSAKQIDLDLLIQQYEEELELKEELENKLAEQNKEFEPLMAEREKEYHEEMEEKLQQFLIEHAARVIQVAWRDTLRNRAEKRKLRKMLKQQEEEKEIAARRAAIQAKKAEIEAKKQAAAAKKAAKKALRQAKLEARKAAAIGEPTKEKPKKRK